MSDIELVIKLSEKVYGYAKRYNGSSMLALREMDMCMNAIANGIPLPKGHGELVDRDAINERFDSILYDAINCSNQPSDKYLLDKLSMCLDTAPTIIEAESEG